MVDVFEYCAVVQSSGLQTIMLRHRTLCCDRRQNMWLVTTRPDSSVCVCVLLKQSTKQMTKVRTSLYSYNNITYCTRHGSQSRARSQTCLFNYAAVTLRFHRIVHVILLVAAAGHFSTRENELDGNKTSVDYRLGKVLQFPMYGSTASQFTTISFKL